MSISKGEGLANVDTPERIERHHAGLLALLGASINDLVRSKLVIDIGGRGASLTGHPRLMSGATVIHLLLAMGRLGADMGLQMFQCPQ